MPAPAGYAPPTTTAGAPPLTVATPFGPARTAPSGVPGSQPSYGAGGVVHPASPAPGGTAPNLDPNSAGPNASNAVDKDITDFEKRASDFSKQLAQGGFDPQQADQFYSEAKAPIEQQFFSQSDQVANYLARQGLGASTGINIGASQQLSNNKEALEGQARLKSQDLARELKRRSLLDAYSTDLMARGPELQNKGIDVSKYISLAALQEQAKEFQDSLQFQKDMHSDQQTSDLLKGITSGGMDIAALAMLSMRGTKEDIRIERELVPGLNLYSYRYSGAPLRMYGFMRDEVEQVAPELIRGDKVAIHLLAARYLTE